MIRRPTAFALGALVALILGAGTACVREKPLPPPPPVKPQTISPNQLINRDISGKPRTPRQGVTPGALEPDAPPPPPNKESGASKPPASSGERR